MESNDLIRTIVKSYPYSFAKISYVYDQVNSYDKTIDILDESMKLGKEPEVVCDIINKGFKDFETMKKEKLIKELSNLHLEDRIEVNRRVKEIVHKRKHKAAIDLAMKSIDDINVSMADLKISKLEAQLKAEKDRNQALKDKIITLFKEL